MARAANRKRKSKTNTPEQPRLETPGDAVCLFDAALESAAFDLAEGAAWIHSARSPVKEVNEDSAALIPVNKQTAVLVVADGVGGHSAGEQASRLIIDSLVESLTAAVSSEQLVRTAILNSLERANAAVLDLRVGAASTVAVVEICGAVARTYHVGDSEILVCGNRGKLKLQTVAHAPVSYAVEAGIINEEQAMAHRDRHIVSNVVGSADMRIEIGPTITLAARDTLLVATDGVFDNLFPDEIIEHIRRGPLDAAAQCLAQAAAERMEGIPDKPSKKDDMTFIVFRRHVATTGNSSRKKRVNPLLATVLNEEDKRASANVSTLPFPTV